METRGVAQLTPALTPAPAPAATPAPTPTPHLHPHLHHTCTHTCTYTCSRTHTCTHRGRRSPAAVLPSNPSLFVLKPLQSPSGGTRPPRPGPGLKISQEASIDQADLLQKRGRKTHSPVSRLWPTRNAVAVTEQRAQGFCQQHQDAPQSRADLDLARPASRIAR